MTDPVSSIAEAAHQDHRALLIAMRDRVAGALDNPNTAARDLASLTRRLMEIAKEIEAIDAAEDNPFQPDPDTDSESFDPATL